MHNLQTKLAKLLVLNASFSIINALIMFIIPAEIAQILLVADIELIGLSAEVIILLLAAGLAGFGLFVGYIGFNLDKLKTLTMVIIVADWAWVATTSIIIMSTNVFTEEGRLYFVLVAAIVALFAYFQGKFYK
ncbi:MAG: hypothetical protein HRU28_05670 [Rhizobiales bacterium]|nr:hypothetical protein [Hyphomicrobiales bacterium]